MSVIRIKVLSIGEKASEESIYAVLSDDGQPPSCVFREIVVASPIDACQSLTVDSTNKYLIIPVRYTVALNYD